MATINKTLNLIRKCGPYKVTVERDGALRVEPTYNVEVPFNMPYTTIDVPRLQAAVAEGVQALLNKPAAKRTRRST